MSFNLFSRAMLVMAFASLASAADAFGANLPPSSSNVHMLGKTTDPNFNTNIYRDGGSSVYANGYHMMIFADTIVDPNGASPASPLEAHNSLAYFGYDDPTDPTIMHDFGSQTPHVMQNVLGAPMPTIPDSNETSAYGIWPSSNMAVLSDGITAVGMFPLVEFATSSAVYSTMVTVKLTDPKTMGSLDPPTDRIVDQFFYDGEPMFGGLSIIQGFLDDFLYMFASVPNGVKLARVQEDQMTDRSQYEYWNGQEFQSQIPQLNDTTANVVQFQIPGGFGLEVGPDVGDVFWSNFHKTYLMVFMDATTGGQFWVAYSTDGGLTNWSTPEKLWQPSPNPTWSDECEASGMGGQWNYGGHAHPHWDSSGKTLLLSWSSCTIFVNMATLTWEASSFGTERPLDNTGSTPTSAAVAGATHAPAKLAASVASSVKTTTPTSVAASSAATSTPASSISSSAAASSVASSLASAASPAHSHGPILSLGPDGAVHFAAALESHRIRKRVAAAPQVAPPRPHVVGQRVSQIQSRRTRR